MNGLGNFEADEDVVIIEENEHEENEHAACHHCKKPLNFAQIIAI
jgi:hypothetical protein